MVASIAALSDANGQVVYVDIEPDFEASCFIDSQVDLDLDDNGIVDFSIRGAISGNRLIAYNGAEGRANQFEGDLYRVLLKLDYDAPINYLGTASSTYKWQTAPMIMRLGSWYVSSSYYASFCSFGSWCSADNQYIGVRFPIDDVFHYGWIRVSIADDQWIVKDYAYSTDPDFGIYAGTLETFPHALNVANAVLEKIEIVIRDGSLYIYGLESRYQLSAYEVSGKKILSGNVDTANNRIDISTHAKGLYILELKDEVTGQTIRKKVIL